MAAPVLVPRFSPGGRMSLAAADPDDPLEASPQVPPALATSLAGAADDPGAMVLRLGAGAPGAPLPVGLGFLRDLGKLVVARLCVLGGEGSGAQHLELPAPTTELEALLEAAPPLRGGEYLTVAALESLWEGAVAALHAAVGDGPLDAWLRRHAPTWHQVGRVHLHLAERKGDPAAPFAFLATYTDRLTRRERPRHLPLGRALKEWGAARDQAALRALLEPVRRAAEGSRLVRELLDSGDLFHPLAWGPREAYALLQEIPHLEAAGVVVKVPDWWAARSRPQVRVTLGARRPSRLGLDGLLDFSTELALDGEVLSPEEAASLIEGSGGLVLLRGRWVEADPGRLRQLLDHWDQVAGASREGLTLGESLRLLAGAELDLEDPDQARDVPPWCQRVAGPWLEEALATLRAGGEAVEGGLADELRATLRPYQVRGLRWLHALAGLGLGACLADDMGLGKTLQVLALLLLRRRAGSGPSLAVVPASLLANWGAEANRFAPSLRVLVAHPSALSSRQAKGMDGSSVRAHDLVLTSYGYLPRLTWAKEVPWDLLVLDEAQTIKNPGARVTRATKALAANCRIALTGTPVENRLGDLWSLFDFLNPGLLGTSKQFQGFVKRLEARPRDRFGPLRRLVGPYLLRRLKSDPEVAPDLPAKTEVLAHCTLSRRQAALYAKAVEGLRERLERAEGVERRGVVLAAMLSFQQICNHPSQWLGDDEYAPADSGKFARLRELCEEVAARQERVLVFTRFRELTTPLAGFLAEVFGREGLVLHGGTPVRRRGTLVQEFQGEGGPPFFVLSLKAGGTGLNLTAARHVIHFDRWWNPAVEDQATDRAYRIGQGAHVLVHKLACRGTVEEQVAALLADKAEMARELLGGEDPDASPGAAGLGSLLTSLGDQELLDLVRLDLAALSP